jgi:hypothetical protein
VRRRSILVDDGKVKGSSCGMGQDMSGGSLPVLGSGVTVWVRARTLYPTGYYGRQKKFNLMVLPRTFGEEEYLPSQLGIFQCRRPRNIQIIVHFDSAR